MIFCVEDDSNIRELVVYTLESTGFQARGFEDGSSFLEALALETPELVLLDIMLPGEDGMELLRKLKASKKTREIPVIMVTAKGAEYDKVKGLDAGADDYVTKPFDVDELLARIVAQLRHSQTNSINSVLEHGDIRLDLNTRTVSIRNIEVKLTKTEYAILKILMENPKQVITKNILLERISEETPDCMESSLRVHISNLRKKLRDISDKEYIEAVWGIGFKMAEE